jgi:hypothetical protein
MNTYIVGLTKANKTYVWKNGKFLNNYKALTMEEIKNTII